MIKSTSTPCLASLESESLPRLHKRKSSSSGKDLLRQQQPQMMFGASSCTARAKRSGSPMAQALPPMAPPYWAELPAVQHAVQNEIAIESSLHVAGFQTMQCEAQFGVPQLASAPNVAISSSDTTVEESNPFASGVIASVAAAAEAGADGEVQAPDGLKHARSLAACLASPVLGEENAARTRLVAVTGVRGTALYNISDDVGQCVDRWIDWVRRIRRKRRLEQIQVLLALFTVGCPIIKKTVEVPVQPTEVL